MGKPQGEFPLEDKCARCGIKTTILYRWGDELLCHEDFMWEKAKKRAQRIPGRYQEFKDMIDRNVS